MEQGKFFEEIRTLEAFFEKELSIEQAKDWYEELKDYPIEKLRIAIRTAKTTCKFLPKLAEFLGFIREAKIEKKENEKIQCEKCNGTGYVIYIKKIVNGNKILGYPYAAICNCGNARPYYGDQIKDYEHRSKYYTATENEVLSENYETIWKEQKDKKVFLKYEQDLWK